MKCDSRQYNVLLLQGAVSHEEGLFIQRGSVCLCCLAHDRDSERHIMLRLAMFLMTE